MMILDSCAADNSPRKIAPTDQEQDEEDEIVEHAVAHRFTKSIARDSPKTPPHACLSGDMLNFHSSFLSLLANVIYVVLI